MTSKERVLRAIEFRNPDRVPFAGPIPALSDIFFTMVYPAGDWQPDAGYAPFIHRLLYLIGNWKWDGWTPEALFRPAMKQQDEFGCIRETRIADSVGEVVEHPMRDIDDLEAVRMPDPRRPERFETFRRLASMFGQDKFLLGDIGNGIWERAHFLRGFAEIMEDLAVRSESVERLLDRLVDEWFLGLIEERAALGSDGVIMTDDWGTQDRLMISPAMWRRIFKPRYARLIEAAHARGMKFILHSCGDIRPILEDLVEIRLDVIQKDDLECLGTEFLEKNFAGRICFMSPLDLQRTLPGANDRAIAWEVKKTIRRLGSKGGGIIGMIYMQPEAVGLTWRQFAVMQYYFWKYGKADF